MIKFFVFIFVLFLHFASGFAADEKFSVSLPKEVNNTVWVGVQGESLNPKFNPSKVKFFSFKGLSQGVVAPIIVNDKAIFLDIKGNLYSLNSGNLRKVFWKLNLTNEKYYSGGLSYVKDLIICVIDHVIYGIDVNQGTVKWQKELRSLVTGEPVVIGDGKSVAVITIDSYLYVLNVNDGALLWTYQGTIPELKNLNSLSPATVKDVLIAPFPDGEVVAFDAASGKKLWSNKFSDNSVNNLFTDINITPRVSKNNVLIVSKSKNVANFDLVSGQIIWSKELNIQSMSAIVKGNAFVITNDNKLAALDVQTGEFIWTSNLTDNNKSVKRMKWNAPIVAGGKLWVLASNGHLLKVNCQSGVMESVMKIPGKSYHSPVVANSSMYITTNGHGLILIS